MIELLPVDLTKYAMMLRFYSRLDTSYSSFGRGCLIDCKLNLISALPSVVNFDAA
jgi:hypothetical protein